MPETWPDHIPRPIAIIGWDGTRYSAFRLRPGGTLQVRGEDQLFSFGGVLGDANTHVATVADDRARSTVVPANTIWKITNIAVMNTGRALTGLEFVLNHDGTWYRFAEYDIARAVNEWAFWKGEIYADPTDQISAYVFGSQIGDWLVMNITGHTMTLET